MPLGQAALCVGEVAERSQGHPETHSGAPLGPLSPRAQQYSIAHDRKLDPEAQLLYSILLYF